jgi:hypothetical protein
MTAGSFISRTAIALTIAIASIGAGSLARPTAAHAATASDCGFKAFDVDTVHMDGGVVDFGDAPRSGSTYGNAVVCFASGRQTITVKGTVFWDSQFSGCGTVGLGPTYYQATDPPVDSLVQFKVCSKGGSASTAVSHTFTTSSYEYAGLGIHLFRTKSDGSSTLLLSQVVNYGD